jgi:hypothetical protein
MRGFWASIAVTAVILTGARALAVDSGVPSSKRQVADCMSRRMSANKTLSYNDASRECKEQVKLRNVTAVSNAPPKPVSER